MMPHLVEYKTADGQAILIEVDASVYQRRAEAPIKVSAGTNAPSGTIAEAQVTFEEALNAIRPSIVGFIGLIDSLTKKPDSVELSFGLKVAGEVGFFSIAKASGEANYALKLTWKG